MATGRRAKDVQWLCRHVRAVSDGQAEVTEVDDNLEFILLGIVPADGLYKGAKLRFRIQFTEEYPDSVPQVICQTNLYHPNIDPDFNEGADQGWFSNICVSLLDEWEASMSLDHIVLAILFLLYNPAIDDALSPYFDSCMTWEEFEQNVHHSLRGLDVDGRAYECVLEDENGNVMPELKNDDANCDNDSNQPDTTSNVTNGTLDTDGSTDDASNDHDTLVAEVLLNRQNSLASGSVKDSLVDPNVAAVILQKDVTRRPALIGDYFSSQFAFDFFPFVRTVPTNLSMNALFPCFQYYDNAIRLFATTFQTDEMDNEVD